MRHPHRGNRNLPARPYGPAEIETGPEALPFPPVWGEPRGPVIYQCCIVTRAYPWKAPKVSKSGVVKLWNQTVSYKQWKSWATDVQMDLIRSYRLEGGRCVNYPVDLDMLFVAALDRTPADRTNLGKSFEDILQGIVYANDRLVRLGNIGRVFIGEAGRPGSTFAWDGPERVHFRVVSLA
jgi:hypothetical protein